MFNGDLQIGPKRVKQFHSSEHDRLMKDFSGLTGGGGLITLHPGSYVLPGSFEKYKDHVYNFQFREDDVLIMTYPKSGTTWTQEVLWTMRHNPDLNHPMALKAVNERCPFLESDMLFDSLEFNPMKAPFSALCPGKDPNDGMVLQMAEAIPERRVLKTHLPPSFFHPSLFDTCKVIFVSRDPRDVILSDYHHTRMLKMMNYTGSFDDYVSYFINDKVMYSPFWEMFHEVLDYIDHPNALFVKYEDMIADPLKEIQQIDQFIGSGLNNIQMNNIADYTSFKEMKKRCTSDFPIEMMNPEVVQKDGGFFRAGKSGKGKEVLSPSQKMKLDIWIKRNTIGKKSQFSKILSY